MDIDSLAQRLCDPDPRVRVETLRILAMVEETRALAAVRWIYENDPEPGVRDVANWAGNLIWKAHQRGHATQDAVEEMFNRSFSPERQARFLKALEFDMGRIGNIKTRKYSTQQAYRRQLDDAMRGIETPEETIEEEETIAALPAPVQLPDAEAPEEASAIDDLDDLLDEGLSDLLLD